MIFLLGRTSHSDNEANQQKFFSLSRSPHKNYDNVRDCRGKRGGCGEGRRQGGVKREIEREADRDAVAAPRLIRRAISTTSSR